MQKFLDWIPGFKSGQHTMAQQAFVATDAFSHRYAREEILLSTLKNPPLSFKPKEIIVRVRLPL